MNNASIVVQKAISEALGMVSGAGILQDLFEGVVKTPSSSCAIIPEGLFV